MTKSDYIYSATNMSYSTSNILKTVITGNKLTLLQNVRIFDIRRKDKLEICILLLICLWLVIDFSSTTSCYFLPQITVKLPFLPRLEFQLFF